MIPDGRPLLAARLKAWWIDKLDNDSVRPWVSLYYYPWLTWAILATFWLPPVVTIQSELNPMVYTIWLWASIPATALPIIGLRMRHGGSAIQSMSNRLLLRDWIGLAIFQAGGHAISCVLLLMLEISLWLAASHYVGPNAYAGLTILMAALLIPWTLGTGMLCAQCLRKVQKALRLEKRAQ